jgi:hypothetical protein
MKKLVFGSMLVAAALVPACAKSPGGPSVSFTSPLASQPSNGTNYKFKEQPVTLTITNAVRTAATTATYSVEVATDAGFANKVFTKDGIAEGNNGTTSLTLGSLAGGATYYWHWKTVIDGVTSAASPTQQFVLAQQVVINAPSTVDPASGGTATTARPTFITKNATRSGPAGTVFYEFQVSTSAAFSSLTASATVQEQSGGQTSWTPSSDLPETTLFWRVRATDPSNTEVSSFTSGASFAVQLFSMKQASFFDNSQGVQNWPETATITSIDFTGDAFLVDFDRRTGPNRWPQSDFGVQYTLGMCLNIDKHWNCAGVVQFWDGRDLEASGIPSEVGDTWFYDSRWGPMQGHQPAQGETVGIFVGQGNLRGNGGSSLQERSNVVLMPFGGHYKK